jgi:hypothetical protein
MEPIASSRKNSELLGILNSGHNRRAASVVRLEKIGKKYTPVQYSTWAPKAIASIGNLSGTLQDRSIAIRLRRKLPSEKVRNFRADRVESLTNLCRMLHFGPRHLDELRKLDALVPDQLNGRQADNWRALFNIADRIGGEWPAKARAAALAIEGAESECENASPTSGIRLLADCQTVFEDKAQRSYPPRKSSPGFAPWTRRLGAILGRVSPSPKQLSPLFLSRTGSHRSARPLGRTKAVRSGTGPTLRTLGGGICDWRAIFLSEPFTPFTALNNKRNPAFGPFTRVKGCDPRQ